MSRLRGRAPAAIHGRTSQEKHGFDDPVSDSPENTRMARLRGYRGGRDAVGMGRGWRPAVVGTGGIQEDRVPGASERWRCRIDAACRKSAGKPRQRALAKCRAAPVPPGLSFGIASRRVPPGTSPVEVPPRGCVRHRCSDLSCNRHWQTVTIVANSCPSSPARDLPRQVSTQRVAADAIMRVRNRDRNAQYAVSAVGTGLAVYWTQGIREHAP